MFAQQKKKKCFTIHDYPPGPGGGAPCASERPRRPSHLLALGAPCGTPACVDGLSGFRFRKDPEPALGVCVWFMCTQVKNNKRTIIIRPGHRSSSPFLQPFRDQSPTCRLIRWEIKNEAPTRVGSPFTANSTHPNVTLRDHVLGHPPPPTTVHVPGCRLCQLRWRTHI